MSAALMNQLLVIDVEAACWDNEEDRDGQPHEIIEIGICKLNTSTLKITHRESLLVRPREAHISEYCTALTGHTWDTLKHGMQFKHALNRLKKHYGIKTKSWATWGDGDRKAFQRECSAKRLSYPFSENYMDASALFRFFTGRKKNTSVTDALSYFGLKFEGTAHRGDDDAYNTARILRTIFSLRDCGQIPSDDSCIIP